MKNAQKLLMAAVALSSLTLTTEMVAADGNEPTYTVTIPASVDLASSNRSASIKTENVSLDTTKYSPINVKLAQASNTVSGSTFHVKEAKTNDVLGYGIKNGGKAVSVGDTIANFTNDNSVTLNFTKPQKASYAGHYTETLTFDISVERKAPAKKVLKQDLNVPVTSVVINDAPSQMTVGTTGSLTATVGPADATDKTVTWTSSAPNVLAIDAATGAYEAKAAGTAIITATAADGQVATCEVSVTVPVTSVTINDAPSQMTVGTTGSLTATVGPADATDKTVTWTSSAPNVLAIDAATGAYEAKAAGTATITATAGNGQTTTCDVEVIVPVTSVVITNAPSESLLIGSQGNLTAIITPENATYKGVTWTSSNPDILTINLLTGAYEAKAEGTVTVTVVASDGQVATCDITVVEPVIGG